MLLLVVGLVGCGSAKPVATAAAGTPVSNSEADSLAKERQAIAEERKALELDREAFKAEQATADKAANDRVVIIRAATAEYEAAVQRENARDEAERVASVNAERMREYKEDVARWASLDGSERIKLGLAMQEFRGGGSTPERLYPLLHFNQYRDAVIERLSKSAAEAGWFKKPADFVTK